MPAIVFPILALDCSTGPCSVALWRDNAIIALEEENAPSRQSKMLMPMVESVLKSAGLNYADLGLVATTVGPGSFTGIRIGLAAARGIGLAANLPVMGLGTLEVMAFAAQALRPDAAHICVLLNAGKGEVYAQHYSSATLAPAGDILLVKLSSILTAVMQDAAIACNLDAALTAALAERVVAQVTHPQAGYIAKLAARRRARWDKKDQARPVYIRPPDAKPNLPAG